MSTTLPVLPEPKSPASEPVAMPRRVRIGRALAIVAAVAAAVLLIIGMRKPYWEMTLQAPQYPSGLHLHVYLDHVEGDVAEVDELNHYIGVGSLADAAHFERVIGIPSIIVLAGALVLAPFAGRKKFLILAIPAVGFPVGFILDLLYWMNHMSHHLDPHAPIKMKPFSFVLWGDAKVAQFMSTTTFLSGFGIACAAAVLAVIAIGLREVVACRSCPHHDDCGMVCKGVVKWPSHS